MKVIILSASFGGGHMSAALAINEYLSKQGIQTEVVDTIEHISHMLNKIVSNTHSLVVKKSPQIWNMIYKTSNHHTVNNLIASTNSLISKKILQLIKNSQADVVLTTHPFPTEMISKLKKSNKINIPLICVMTDYAPHMTWLNSQVDAYIVATSQMISPMSNMGINPSTIHPFGIPVKEEFFIQKDKNVILHELGLSQNMSTILVMSGSCGLSSIEKIYNELQSLDTKCQIIIITGKNPKLYNQLQNLSNENKYNKSTDVHIIYFTDKVSQYMQVADLLITKPGGLTISEALASNLPMALFDAIPGQEVDNAKFLINNNMGIKLNAPRYDIKIIENLLKNKRRLEKMKDSCKKFDKSESLPKTYQLINKLYNQYNKEGDNPHAYRH